LAYEGLIKNSIKRFKFSHKKEYAYEFAKLITKTIEICFRNQKFDLITCVPLHKNRFKKRGYNQSELIAKEAAKSLGFQFEKTIVKTKNNLPQHGLNFFKRQINVNGAYKAIRNLSGKKILICDDIVTTGATLNECVSVLEAAGAKVACACLAYTRRYSS
jgi:ComF family protein